MHKNGNFYADFHKRTSRLLMQQQTNTGLTVDDLWDSMKRVWKESAELVLGNKRHISRGYHRKHLTN